MDIAGLVKGASKGEGLGNKFLAHIREVDAILHVVRCFESKDIVHVSDTLDPLADIETITAELILADLQSLTMKPTLFVCNVAQSDLGRADELPLVKKVRDLAALKGSETIAISALHRGRARRAAGSGGEGIFRVARPRRAPGGRDPARRVQPRGKRGLTATWQERARDADAG